MDAELVHWIGQLGQDDEGTAGSHGPRVREPSRPQLGAVDACVSLASDDGSPSTYCRGPLVAVLAYRERWQRTGQLGKIFRPRAADHAALHGPKEERRKCKRNASPPHAPILSGRFGAASDRTHTRGGAPRARSALDGWTPEQIAAGRRRLPRPAAGPQADVRARRTAAPLREAAPTVNEVFRAA